MAKRFEGSAADKAGDAILAKKEGLTPDEFEDSAMDQDHDAAGQAGNNRAEATRLSGEGRASEMQPHHFGFKRPRM